MNTSNYRDKISKDKCSMCGVTAEQITEKYIEVDHKDTDHTNNDVSNLWALCKFCHNIKSKYENLKEPDKFWVIYLGTGYPEIKKTLNDISLEYFDDESTLKDHNSIFRMYDNKLEFVRKRYIDIIEKKTQKFFNVLDKKVRGELPSRNGTYRKQESVQELKKKQEEKDLRKMLKNTLDGYSLEYSNDESTQDLLNRSNEALEKDKSLKKSRLK